jgi:hypothetical protein
MSLRTVDAISSTRNPLAELLEACASITKRSLAYRTLSHPTPTTDDGSAALRADCATEKSLAAWLDRRIVGYQAREHSTNFHIGPPLSKKALQRAVLQRQQYLVDESIRQQQEYILLTRIVNSKAAIAASSDNQSPSRLLSEQGIHSRNGQVAMALEKNRQLIQLRTNLRNSSAECRRLQRENQTMWQNLQQQQQQPDNDLSTNESPTGMLVREKLALTRIMSDLIAGSELDWSGDSRLRQIMASIGGNT